jgi:peptidyl-prolyl cis-trans isomerase B (cyclophilin B)
MSRYISLAIVAILVIFAIFAVQKQLKPTDTPKQAIKQQPTGTKSMNISMKTNHGTITLELYPDKAPITVKNFIEYIESGHFNGTIFHRVIPGFMIQGGGFVPGMSQKDVNAPIKNEADNGLANDDGTIAMARTPDPDSATAQFFINVKDNSFLNYSSPTPQGWGYCVFGKVVEGMDVVRAIEKVATASAGMHQDVPVDDVIIEDVQVIEAAAE